MNWDPTTMIFIVSMGAVALLTVVSLVIGVYVTLRRENKSVMQRFGEREETLKNMMTPGTEGTNTLGQIWFTKHQENTEYFLIITRHLKLTFALALSSAIFGLVLFAITICVALAFREKLVVAIIPAVSAAIVELFGGIVLAVHRATLKQVAHFSDMSNQDERLYSSLLFSQTLSPQNREMLVSEILKSEADSVQKEISSETP